MIWFWFISWIGLFIMTTVLIIKDKWDLKLFGLFTLFAFAFTILTPLVLRS